MMQRPLPLSGEEQCPHVLRHLQRLTRSFVHEGHPISYVHIYACAVGPGPEPPLTFITAQESGFEGIACIDDAARAAMLALRIHEETGSAAALRLAHDWLGFVTYMQEPDGRFINFIMDEAGTKNRHGRTSYAGGKWWNARALWALATAWRVTGDEGYLHHFRRGRLTPTRDMKVKGVQALALMELYQHRPDEGLRRRICTLCDAIVASGPAYFRDRVGQAEVALWGYHQLHAVARAAHLFSRLDYAAACASTVHSLVEPVVDNGFYETYPSRRDPQCAYCVSTLVLGLEELYRLTRAPSYRDLALACAAWLDGNNLAGVALYDAGTGRCADGVSASTVSPNCGAESAIEAGFMELARRHVQGRERVPEVSSSSQLAR